MEILLGLLLLAIPFVLPIASWVRGSRLRDELVSQSLRLKDQEEELRRLTNRVAELESAFARPESSTSYGETSRARDAAPVTRPAVTPPVVEAPPKPIAPPPPPASPKPPEIPRGGEGGPPHPIARPPVPPAPPVPPPEPPEPPTPWLQLPAFDWESFVGVRLFSAIAGIALVLAGVFFLRYSIEHGWLQPTVRVIIGLLTGMTLLVVCEMKAARRYPITANALDAAAIAILFSTFFSAYALWKLIPALAAFVLLAVVTATAVLLSIRRESLFIAVLGLLGGFATPMLLSTGENNPIGLFSYLLLLNVGLAWVAYRQRWPVLTALSLVLTTLYQWGWVFKFLDAGQLPIATGIFVVFAIVGFAGLVLAGARSEDDEAVGHFEKFGLLAAVMPMLFAVYFAAVPAYRDHFWLLFTFLFFVDAGLLAIALTRREPLLQATSAVLTLIVFGAWLASSYTHAAWPSVLAIASVFVVFYLLAPVLANRVERPLTGYGAFAIYAAPVLLYVFAVLVRIEEATDAPIALFGVPFALTAAIAGRAVVAREGGLFFVAAFFVLVAEALWSARFVRTERLTDAVVLYAAFGALYLAVPLMARRVGRALEPAVASGIVLIAGMALLFFLATPSIAPQAMWAFALLLTILNAALFIESGAAGLPALSLAGSALSWLLLATWWYQAAGAVGVQPSLLMLVVLTLLMLAGYAWNRRTEPAAESIEQPLFAHGLYLALVGDVFLAALASQPQWATPPWPLFGALVVITLALLVTALAFADGILHLAALIAATAVAVAYVANASVAPWPTIGVALFAGMSVLALAWLPLAQRFRFGVRARQAAAAVTFIGMFGAMIASVDPAVPAVWVLTAFHGAASITILALTTYAAWAYVPIGASVVAGLAVGIWASSHATPAMWLHLLVFGATLYGVFVAYPLVLGRQSARSRDPYIAAIVGSGWFFFAARHAVITGGFESIIGVVPVALGAVMALLLYQLLKLEEPGQRDLGRLALVAGVGLAFVTVAIPLQLREQWITIGWALEGAALAWLLTRIPHRGLLYGSVGLLAAVFIRLAMNPEIFDYPRSATPVFNWYLYTYVVAATATFASAWWLTRTDVQWASRVPQAATAAGVNLLFFLLNIEIADYHAQGQELVFRFGTTIEQDLTYTIGWLVFGLALLAAGITLSNRPARMAAVALIAVTTFKCFLYDLGSLEGLYRVAAFVGLAISLTLVSLALQKFVLAQPRQAT